MADRVLFISWNAPVRGREERGLKVFNEAMGKQRYYVRMGYGTCYRRLEHVERA